MVSFSWFRGISWCTAYCTTYKMAVTCRVLCRAALLVIIILWYLHVIRSQPTRFARCGFADCCVLRSHVDHSYLEHNYTRRWLQEEVDSSTPMARENCDALAVVDGDCAYGGQTGHAPLCD